MYPLSAQDILKVWEQGQAQHPVDRALSVLAAGMAMSPEALATLSIGQRDAHLLTLRELTFGTMLKGFAECSRCRERLEYTLDTASIRVPYLQEQTEFELETAGFELRFRLPDSSDLVAITGCPDPSSARRLLVQRCVLTAHYKETSIVPGDLSDEVIARLAAHIEEADPQAEVRFALECPACGHHWQALFDIATFFWVEITVQAKRLLCEVHTLARTYNWRELDILAMSAFRRQCYLEMVS
jgi:hypothetical protein